MESKVINSLETQKVIRARYGSVRAFCRAVEMTATYL
jgi:hypothetical protein